MKVAVTHDYLKEYGGAERVLELILEMFPEAPLYTAFYSPEGLGIHNQKFADRQIITSWLQNLPFAKRLLSPFRLFAPLMFESFNLKDFDVVISSSSAVYFAKAVLTKPETLHISYIHTPPRYLYGYTTAYDYKKNPLLKLFVGVGNHFMRLYDFELSQRPDILVANSKNIAGRIKKFYRRESTVIYPPVDLAEFLAVKKKEGEYFLSLGRLDRGKRVDVVIEACNRLKLPLKVVGVGAEMDNLKKIAGETVEFLGSVSDVERVELYAKAKALIVAAEDEDFGITPVESQAAGTPVVALNAGGYKETIVENKTGVFFDDPSIDSLMAVLQDFDEKKYKVEDCRKNAERFSKQQFIKQLSELIDKNLPTKH